MVNDWRFSSRTSPWKVLGRIQSGVPTTGSANRNYELSAGGREIMPLAKKAGFYPNVSMEDDREKQEAAGSGYGKPSAKIRKT